METPMSKVDGDSIAARRRTERPPGTWEMISEATVIRKARDAGLSEAELAKLDVRSVASLHNIDGIDFEKSRYAHHHHGGKIGRFSRRATKAREGLAMAQAQIPVMIEEMEGWPAELQDGRLQRLKTGYVVISEMISDLAPARKPGGHVAREADYVAGLYSIISNSIGLDAIKLVATSPGVRFIDAMVTEIYGCVLETPAGGNAPEAGDGCTAIAGILRRQRKARMAGK
jgi:hypothetical protein